MGTLLGYSTETMESGKYRRKPSYSKCIPSMEFLISLPLSVVSRTYNAFTFTNPTFIIPNTVNLIEIFISSGWCVAIDWVALQIGPGAPPTPVTASRDMLISNNVIPGAETLAVEIDFPLTAPTTCNIAAGLTDSTGDQFAFVNSFSTTVTPISGTATVTLPFSGPAICGHGVPGPYLVTNLIITCGSAVYVSSANAHTTAPYALCEFEGCAPCNVAPDAVCKNVQENACGSVAVSINDGSSDPDGLPLPTCVQSPAGPYGFGTTLVTLTCTDPQGASDTCTGAVTVGDATVSRIMRASYCPLSSIEYTHCTCLTYLFVS